MIKTTSLEKPALYRKIRVLANRYRFRIMELTQNEQITITRLSSLLKLSYTKCSDYVRFLEKEGLVRKTRNGKEVLVKSNVVLQKDELIFGSKGD